MNDHKKLTTKELREFGLLTGGIIGGLFGLILPLIQGHSLPIIPWIIAIILVGLAIILPNSLDPFYQVWMKIGFALGWLNSRIILSIVFFIMLTPMALIMKLLKRDTMARKFDFQVETYRISSKIYPSTGMEKPY
jgi:hypothetical protein